MEWDEASCGQLVWLYNEAISHYDGHTESFFNALARPDRLPEPGEVNGRALRVASIDIGGGTTDMAVVHYQLDDGVGRMSKSRRICCFVKDSRLPGMTCCSMLSNAACYLPCKPAYNRRGYRRRRPAGHAVWRLRAHRHPSDFTPANGVTAVYAARACGALRVGAKRC